MKAKKSFNNIIFGLVNQAVAIAFGFVLPRMFILTFGSEINGLLSTIGQVFIFINLFEAGIGTTTIQALYEPLAKHDQNSVNEILAATNHYYRKVGIYYLISVLILSIVFPLVVKSSVDRLTIMLIILLVGLSSVLIFFLQGKIRLLLIAEGKNYILLNIATVINLLTSISKIVLIVNGFNIITIHAVYLIINVLQIGILYLYIYKNYKWIDLKVKPNLKALSQKNSVFIHQISSLIFSNTDILLLTFFCGFKVVSVYVLYNMLFNLISTLLSSFDSSMMFVLGHKYHEDKLVFLKINSAYELINITSVFAVFSVTYIFVLPFLKLYTSGIFDISYIDQYLPILFTAIKLLSSGRNASGNIINVTGNFKSTQYRSIIESSINIVVSAVCVIWFGIYGVLIGTIIALLYRTNDMIKFANKRILHRSSLNTYLCWFINLILFILTVFTVNMLNIDNSSYVKIIINASLLLIIVLPLFFGINFLFRTDDFKYIYSYSRNMLHKKL